MGKKYKPEIRYEIEVEEDQHPVRGNFATGDDRADEDLENEIITRQAGGDVWAWCHVRVKAIGPDGAEAYSDWLGGCSYKDEADYRNDGGEGYFTDQCDEARANLTQVEQSYRQTIQTKYQGPTDGHGSRIKVTGQPGTKYVAYDHALDLEQNHAAAAHKYAVEHDFLGRWVGGRLPDGKTFVFVNVRDIED